MSGDCEAGDGESSGLWNERASDGNGDLDKSLVKIGGIYSKILSFLEKITANFVSHSDQLFVDSATCEGQLRKAGQISWCVNSLL